MINYVEVISILFNFYLFYSMDNSCFLYNKCIKWSLNLFDYEL